MTRRFPVTKQRNEAYDYEIFRDENMDRRHREEVDVECGLVDGPIQGFSVSRGASMKTVIKELTSLQEIFREKGDEWDERDDEYNKKPNPNLTAALVAWEARCKRFAEADPKDIYVVFYDDCLTLEPPIKDPRKFNKAHPDFGTIYDEWNVFANWSDGDPNFLKVWDRRKVPFLEACERIKSMTSIPEPPPKIFIVNPAYKQKIAEMLPKRVHIEDKDSAPYKLVMEQLRLAVEINQAFAELAAQKLMALICGGIPGYKPPYVNVEIFDVEQRTLTFSQCQYDRWEEWHKFLSKYCKIEPWDGKYETFPVAQWDLSQDPDFAESEQKIFPISIRFDDAHWSGF